MFYDFNLTEKCELNIDDARLAGGVAHSCAIFLFYVGGEI